MKVSRKPFPSLWRVLLLLSSLILLACGGGGSSSGGSSGSGSNDDTPSVPRPTDASIVIAEDWTKTAAATARLAAKDAAGVTGYYLSESETTPDLTADGWVDVTSDADYTADVNLTLSDNREVKTVWAWFRNAAGKISDATSDTVARVPVPAPFVARWAHQVVVFNDRMYLISGSLTGNNLSKEVWSSADGAIWNRETNALPFAGNTQSIHAMVFNDEIRIFELNNTITNSYSSANGRDWRSVTINGNSLRRVSHEMSTLGARLILTGGLRVPSPQRIYGDVWESSNGSDWTQTANGGYGDKTNHRVAELGGTLYMTGGTSNFVDFTSDVHSSTDGRTWSDVTADGGFPGRGNHEMVAFNDRLYVIGGATTSRRLADVWTSADRGRNWTRFDTTGDVFSARAGHQVVAFKNKLYLVGGNENTADILTLLKDVYVSDDASVWTQLVE